MAVFDVLNPLKNITPKFTEEQLNTILEWFDEHSKPLLILNDSPEPTNVITIEQFQEFLALQNFHRRTFHYPSYFEIMKEAEFLNAGVTRMLTQDQVIYMLNKWVLEPDLKHELKLAFQVFDTEKRGFLEVEELRDIVTSYGDPFTAEEVVEFLRDVNVRGSGFVDYNNFVDTMFNNTPKLYELTKEYLYENPDEDPSIPPPPPKPEPEPTLEPENLKNPEIPVDAPLDPAPVKKGKEKGGTGKKK